MAAPLFATADSPLASPDSLRLNSKSVAEWLVAFLKDEVQKQRGIQRAIVGLSGGVDSAVTTALCVRAFGPENTYCFLMPYRTSHPDSLNHARLVADQLGVQQRVIDISAMADGYLNQEPNADTTRRGNIFARCRAVILFDQSAALRGLPIGTGNKTERMFGYFTWHADDSPPINPLGDLWKTQVFDLARYLEIPDVIVNKPPTADLVAGQTDEGDLGISYARADLLLNAILRGYAPSHLTEIGFLQSEVDIVMKRVNGTHWKRKMPTVAMLSDCAINEAYLRPVDYR